MSDRISVTVEEGVAQVRLNRPDKMNALDAPMFEALIETPQRLDADRSVRAVVLAGEGRGFCAGLDMSMFERFAGGDRLDLVPRTHGDANHLQQAILGWRRLRAPVIAAVQGVALGGGFQLMMAADLRILHPEAKCSILEVKWGLVPDLGATLLFGRVAPEDVVRELTYTGRMFSGAEAKDFGFATRLSETPIEAATELAREIASKSPEAVQGAKRLYNAIAEEGVAEALRRESEIQQAIIGTPNQIEAVMAGLEKRPARFKD